MIMHKNFTRGFTIVELLIVSVVIGILAGITIVAYNGVQNRANDASVQSDLRNNGQKIESFKITKDAYPQTVADLRDIAGITFNKAAVSEAYNNTAIYCEADGKFSLVVLSKSGKGFYYKNGDGVQEYTPTWSTGSASLCPSSGIGTLDPGYNNIWLRVNSAWLTWL